MFGPVVQSVVDTFGSMDSQPRLGCRQALTVQVPTYIGSCDALYMKYTRNDADEDIPQNRFVDEVVQIVTTYTSASFTGACFVFPVLPSKIHSNPIKCIRVHVACVRSGYYQLSKVKNAETYEGMET